MSLPRILCGPIVRRLEPKKVSVWVALSENMQVKLQGYKEEKCTHSGPEGGCLFTTDARSAFESRDPEWVNPYKFGECLYVAVVTADCGKKDAHGVFRSSVFQPNAVYSYNILLKSQNETTASSDLRKENLLKEQSNFPLTKERQYTDDQGVLITEPPETCQIPPLGGASNTLPSFRVPPADVKGLVIVHGSCRHTHSEGADMMAYVDDLIQSPPPITKSSPEAGSNAGAGPNPDPTQRPHLLALTGDQIYSDIIHVCLGHLIGALAGQIRGAGKAAETVTLNGLSFRLDARDLPYGLRQRVCVEQGKLTTGGGSMAHMLSFEEFCAAYLVHWNPAVYESEEWAKKPRQWVDPSIFKDDAGNWKDPTRLDIILPWYEEDHDKKLGDMQGDAENRYKTVCRTFLPALSKVRRALANVVTYMMFDDHEVTDDWYLSETWKVNVLTSVLGKTILRNALMAYTVFQGWGNDPEQFKSIRNNSSSILSDISMFVTTGDETARNKVDKALLGLREDNLNPNGIALAMPEVKWHCEVPLCWDAINGTPIKAKLKTLDTRMRRTYRSAGAPPTLIDPETGLNDQLPDFKNLPEGERNNLKLLVLIATVPIINPPAMDELLAPSQMYISSLFEGATAPSWDRNEATSVMPAIFSTDYEPWCGDQRAFEKLLERLATYPRVLVLSGDIHFGNTTETSYWKRSGERWNAPTRITHCTSSGFKNKWPSKFVGLARSFSLASQAFTLWDRVTRVGWQDVRLKLGVCVSALPTAYRARLRARPAVVPAKLISVFLPNYREPENLGEPDFAYDIAALADDRAEEYRPENVQFDPPEPGKYTGWYGDLARKHFQAAGNLLFSRRTLFTHNLGRVTIFGDNLQVRHELFSVHPQDEQNEPSSDLPNVQPYTIHESPLPAAAPTLSDEEEAQS